MHIKTVLFDLDGTLLPMDQDQFIKTYFGLLAKTFSHHGYNPEQLINAVMTGTQVMVHNDGKVTNEAAFWQKFCECFGEQAMADMPLFEDFYRNAFQTVKAVCGYNPEAVKAVREIRERGMRTVLATNPLFPAIATHSRVRWAGLVPEDFEYITTYENANYCKPNPEYYSQILEKLTIKPEECLMVGNDAVEDVAAQSVGMHVFLLTDCLINKTHVDISNIPNGSFSALLDYISNGNA